MEITNKSVDLFSGRRLLDKKAEKLDSTIAQSLTTLPGAAMRLVGSETTDYGSKRNRNHL